MVLEPRVSPEHTWKYVDTVTVFAKTWTKGHWPLDDLWLHICWGHMYDSTQESLCPSPMKIMTSKYVDTVTLFAKTWTKGHWPLDDLWPHIYWGLMCDSTQGSLCPSPMKIHQSMWIQWPFLQKKNLNQRSLTPRWPLTPHLLRSHVWLYPRIIVSKSHENTSKYVDTVNLFAKTWTKGHWPLDDLWPHICWGHRCDSNQGSWGHMCDSTQGHWPLDDLWPHGSLCPSPMTVHQCMWIQWSILQNTTYIHTTYILHTTYRMSDHIVSYWTQFRRDKKQHLGVHMVKVCGHLWVEICISHLEGSSEI